MNSQCQNLISKYLLTFWKKWEKDFVLHDLSEEWIKETLIQSWKDYVCNSANVIQFYWLSSELIEDWMNQDINVTQQYMNALQRSDQMIWTFATHLSILKHQLSLYSDEHKRAHLFIKLKSELRIIITNVQSISITQDALIDLVAWLKTNLRKEHVLSLKWSWDENLHDQDKINKKTHLKRKKSHRSTRLDSSSKTSSHASSCYSKNLFNITCYMCNQKSHYFTDYKDEKIKNRSKKFNVNWVFINSMLHMSRFKISEKGKLLMNTSNHWEKNKKFSL